MIDTILLIMGMTYLIIILRDYRYDTFLKSPDTVTEAKIYFDNYMASPVKENYLLFGIALLMWAKAIIQLKYLEYSGNQYQMILQFIPDLKGFMAIFIVSIILLSVIGMLIFRESSDF